MNPGEWVTTAVTEYSKTVILALLVVTAGIGYGVTFVEQSSSTDQFESDTPESRALEYVGENFSRGEDDVTTVQVIVRNREGNVLTRESLLRSLRYQQSIREDPRISETLTEENPVIGVSNIVAITAIRLDQFENLSAQARELQERNASLTERRQQLRRDQQALQERSRELNATVDRLRGGLDEVRELQVRYDRLNASLAAGEIDEATYRERADEIESELDAATANATEGLDAEGRATFVRAAGQVRTLQNRLSTLNASLERGEITREEYAERAGEIQDGFEETYRLGTRGVLADEFRALGSDAEELERRGEELRADGQALREDFERLQQRQGELAGADQPTLDEQIQRLEAMNDSEVREVVTAVLSEEGASSLFEGAAPAGGNASNAGGNGGGFGGDEGADFAFRLMATDYEPGSPEATARVMLVRQSTDGGAVQQGPGGPSDEIVDAQLAMEDLGVGEGGEEYLVFGFGKISDEIQRSQNDSLKLISPLALVFVLVTLLIAYRDPLDILLGFLGIFAVLVWAFGAMGWMGITFNQIMVAVPVLLIGLSIDYAIHIFMRHREQRMETGEGTRGSMRIAMAGVGVALLWVTATTVIGFLSNVISPLPPIADFGVVSSVGIVAALVVFGGLIPAMKVELDALLESFGLDRKKRAFGTGGGPVSRALSVGAVAARRAPVVVIVLALLVTAVGAYGGSQVDTSFSQEDFLAEDPPAWMDELPEAIRPSDYSAKAELGYVNENFQREDSQVQVLIRGDVATPEALERMERADQRAANSEVTFVLSNGEASIESPLRTMRAVAAQNESFNATFTAADTDGDGVPDENVRAVYDALFEVAPDRAANVIQRQDGDYVAARMVVGVDGGASTGEVTEETRGFAGELRGDGLEAQATGSQVVNEVVQQDLFDSVINSLVISMAAVFLFLMIAYRLTEGSALLGAVTLLPVLFSVAWILGTMFLLGVPFNVLTGTITSLTIGLGVAYSIHISERYRLELDRQGNVTGAMDTAVTGTGGALLGSAATTVGGFGTLIIAILPPLQQFGLITALTIVYAFLGSVLVLPSLLVVWTRRIGPDVPATPDGTDRGPEAQSDVIDSPADDRGSTDADPADATDGESTDGESTDGESTDGESTDGEDPGAGSTGADEPSGPDPVFGDEVDVTPDPEAATDDGDAGTDAGPGDGSDAGSATGPDAGAPPDADGEGTPGSGDGPADEGSTVDDPAAGIDFGFDEDEAGVTTDAGSEGAATDAGSGGGPEPESTPGEEDPASGLGLDTDGSDPVEGIDFGFDGDDAGVGIAPDDGPGTGSGTGRGEEGGDPDPTTDGIDSDPTTEGIDPDPTTGEVDPGPGDGAVDAGAGTADDEAADRDGDDDAEPFEPFGGQAKSVPDADAEDSPEYGPFPESPDGEDRGDGSSGTTDGDGAGSPAGAVAPGPATSGDPSEPPRGAADPVRNVRPEIPVPGERIRVTVAVPERAGRTMLAERLPSPEAGIVALEPDPLNYARVDDVVYALWDFEVPTAVELEYVVPVPPESSPGQEFVFDGRVETDDGEVVVGGTGRVGVITELEARALDGGRITLGDLEVAGRRAADGELPTDRLEWLYRQWLAGDDAPVGPSPVEFDPPRRGSGDAGGGDDAGGRPADDPGEGESPRADDRRPDGSGDRTDAREGEDPDRRRRGRRDSGEGADDGRR